MDELLRNLENESLLLLYLAGELPVKDRQEIDALLATDGVVKKVQLVWVKSSEYCGR